MIRGCENKADSPTVYGFWHWCSEHYQVWKFGVDIRSSSQTVKNYGEEITVGKHNGQNLLQAVSEFSQGARKRLQGFQEEIHGDRSRKAIHIEKDEPSRNSQHQDQENHAGHSVHLQEKEALTRNKPDELRQSSDEGSYLPKIVDDTDWYYRGRDLRIVHYDDGIWEVLEGPEFLPVIQGFFPVVKGEKPPS
jgi:hypothetical protein